MNFLEGDAVVLAVGFKDFQPFDGEIKEMIPEFYSIGDCVKPRMIKEAIEEGFCIGRKI